MKLAIRGHASQSELSFGTANAGRLNLAQMEVCDREIKTVLNQLAQRFESASHAEARRTMVSDELPNHSCPSRPPITSTATPSSNRSPRRDALGLHAALGEGWR
jgi:hypothetical protein